MNDVTISTFDTSDRAGVVELWKQCFPNDPPHNEPHWLIDRKVAMHDGLFFVAKNNGVIAGTVLAGYDGVRGWIYHLATHPELRRAGIATAMMRHAMKVLKEKGCPKINLQVRRSNTEVVAFYQSMGFSEDQVLSMGLRLP